MVCILHLKRERKLSTSTHPHIPIQHDFSVLFPAFFHNPYHSEQALIYPPPTSEVWRHLVSPSHSWVGCQLHQLLAQPLCLACLAPLVPRDWLVQTTTMAKARLTFGVQEVKGSSHILYYTAGLSLIEVLPLLDVGQDGTWEAEKHREMPFQALLSTTCQRPSVHRFGWGT